RLLAVMSNCILARSRYKKSFVRRSTCATLNNFEGSARATLATMAVIEADREFLMRYRHHFSITSADACFAAARSQYSSAMCIDSRSVGAGCPPRYIIQSLCDMY